MAKQLYYGIEMSDIERAAIALVKGGKFAELKTAVRSLPGVQYGCCPDANVWVVLKHWQSDSWHIEYQCQNTDHWTPNCQVVQASSYEDAIAKQKELNS